MSDRVFIHSNFEIVGQTLSQTINAFFTVFTGSSEKVIVEEGVASNGLKGNITKFNGFVYEAVPNAKVVALKNGVLYDFDITREDGSYYLYLETGVYDIRIEGQAYNRTIKNYEVKSGIKPYRQMIKSGQVKEKKLDTVRFVKYDPLNPDRVFDDGQRLIVGHIIDEQGEPVSGAEIIVAKVSDTEDSDDRKIKAFIRTDENGKYMFVVDRENYDIVVRSPKHHAKVIKDHLFIPDNGFMPDIVSRYLVFQKDGDWTWISS